MSIPFNKTERLIGIGEFIRHIETPEQAKQGRRGDGGIRQSTHPDQRRRWHRARRLFPERNPG